jgi:hypothetical protein
MAKVVVFRCESSRTCCIGSSRRGYDIPVTDLATLTAILYAARFQRRVPESEAEKHRTIADAIADAKLILAAASMTQPRAVADILATPEQPPPSPGTIGRIADAKATRRRG